LAAPIETASLTRIPRVQLVPIEGGLQQHRIISQEAINFLTKCVWANSPDVCTPTKLKSKTALSCLDFDQVVMPMVHPMMGKTISSYKLLMHDPATTKIWQTAFGKDFGSMAQGDLKTGQKGMNSIFVMSHAEILNTPKNKPFLTPASSSTSIPQKWTHTEFESRLAEI
jgi:hypothetical protein